MIQRVSTISLSSADSQSDQHSSKLWDDPQTTLQLGNVHEEERSTVIRIILLVTKADPTFVSVSEVLPLTLILCFQPSNRVF